MRYDQLSVDDAQHWTELTNTFVPMDHRIADPARWRSTLTVQRTTTYSLLRWDEPGDRVAYRTPSLVRRAAADGFYWLVLPQRDAFTISWQDDGAAVPPGRAVLMGLDQVCRMRPGPSALALQLPRTGIDHALPPDGPRRLVLDLSSGLGRVTDSMIRSVHAEQSRLDGREFDGLCDRIGELLCMLALGDLRPQHAHLDETVAAVRRHVRATVGIGDLRLPAVAQALGWSPRQVRVALQHAGTTYRELRREEALRFARDILESPGPHAPSITEIAARSGFTPTWFSAAFKARYGESPREFRQRRAADAVERRRPG
ncbi:AraC family transcriptional regulator [Nocardia blacklockiae]|uniref:AraC family transcriptional regulator n=1 Tax=Nocardia blacklockiae TaxID=480036 RepID=UPI001894A0EF|nr:AraC family transcriptional regulator [Nocardia blacklockiae]MBF6172242.1 AraC family transcriptional regulator [Nocardia blacklockiae]